MRGPGSVKAQGAAGIAAELVAMASDILDYPESGLRRSALAHAVREVIRAEGDAPLLRAIEVAPDLHVARAIRAAAEAACEVISVVENGTERHAGLFSVPFVVRFTDAIATQEFEDALALASWSEPFLGRLHDCGARHSISLILPHVFLFEDLSNLSFASVHHGTMMASATTARGSVGAINPFPTAAPPQRRKATFLRYLVGYRVKGDRTPDRTAEYHAKFCDCVRGVLRVTMPDAQDVVAIYTEHFYEPIWQGLWIYHIYRLAEVVRAIATNGVALSDVTASIIVDGTKSHLAARVAFFCRGQLARHHAYSIPIKPLEDPRTSADRITAELRTLGVRRVATAPGRVIHGSDERRTAQRRSAPRDPPRSELMLPL